MWDKFSWPRIGLSGGIFEHSNESYGTIKGGNFF
jgi:hypothetical protein